MIKSERCIKCKGRGSFSNPMLKRTEKCKQCNGKGWIDKEYPDPVRRTSGCPIDCAKCAEEKYAVCQDKSILTPKYNDLSKGQLANYDSLALTSTWAMIIIFMMKYPNNRIRIGKSITVAKNEGAEVPPAQDPAMINPSLYFTCVMTIGTAIRTGEGL